MTDAALKRSLLQMATNARTRSFGVRDTSQTQAMIRHGYLLAIEEVEQALKETPMSPHDHR